MNRFETDVLIIGAGIAGLEAACAASQAGASALVLSKGACASVSVLGLNAPVGPGDSEAIFCRDTRLGGGEIGEEGLIRALAHGAAKSVKWLENEGLSMDRAGDDYHLLQPLGCSVPRLVHHGNETGRASVALLRATLQKMGVPVMEPWMVMELMTEAGRVQGAWAFNPDTGERAAVRCGAVVLATGGAHLMRGSTYPITQTADGFALASRAGATLTDMEFIQFEPCRAVWPKPLGLSTTLLSHGGTLKNALGERFVLRHFAREGDASKDALARLIALEIAQGRGTPHGGVWLDLTGLPPEEIRGRHRLYYERFLAAGIDLTRDRVEVGPSAHSMMGGVMIDETAATTVPGLYAAGEVTGGLHGANRIGGNAGAEIYVFGEIAGRSAAAFARQEDKRLTDAAIDAAIEKSAPRPEGREGAWFAEKQRLGQGALADHAGPLRDGPGLAEGLRILTDLEAECLTAPAADWPAAAQRRQALNLLSTGKRVCRAALIREESRGVHYRTDYPTQNDHLWQRHVTLEAAENGKEGA